MKIAIYGPMCSGKSTVASIIKEIKSEYKIYSFGQKIKDIASELFNMEGKNRSLLINIADNLKTDQGSLFILGGGLLLAFTTMLLECLAGSNK